ncbi:MAG: DEAD/DEAH box helicase [Thermoleophilaceae bacterium]
MSVAARPWQAAFLDRHAQAGGPDFLLVATPGAGKTLAACLAARASGCERIVVVCPTTALRAQWADAADRAGLHLDPRWRNADGVWPPEADGVVVTYQQVASAPDLFAHHLARPSFVVLDEIHHAGESASWGAALRAAFGEAERRLALSGTPFRSDAAAIPFVRYDDERRCAPDFVYGYADAVADDVCRPLAFRLLDATLRWRVDAQETIAAFADELDPLDDARRLRTAIDPVTPLPTRLLGDADALLVKARAVVPDAAGLVLCDDRAHARATAKLLRTLAGEKPVVVVSDEAGAHGRIERFARGEAQAPRWLVAVNMVSEGVDVPRLVLAGYLTVKRTDPVLPPGGRQGGAPPTRRSRGSGRDGLPARRPDAEDMRRARRGRAAPADLRGGRRLRRRAAARCRSARGLPGPRRARRAGRCDRRGDPLRPRGGRRRAAAAARARPARAGAAAGARVRAA